MVATNAKRRRVCLALSTSCEKKLRNRTVALKTIAVRWFSPLTLDITASSNSGNQTHQAATNLADEIGARFFDFSIAPMIEAYQQQFLQQSSLTLDWDHDDIALQNLQARARAPLAWLLANKLKALLITTSNRSEAAVGYATMDGDMAGSIAPLAGISKTFLRRFLRWHETECTIGVGKIVSLKTINDLPPTAELRPPESAQTDETDLMPYEVLDAIEAQTVGAKLAPEQILYNLQLEFPAISPYQLKLYFDKFQHLWRVNQWKRERIAPSFHVDQISQDPKYWGRFPILRAEY